MLGVVLSEFSPETEIKKVYPCDLKFTGSCSTCYCKASGFYVVEDDLQQVMQDMIRADICRTCEPSNRKQSNYKIYKPANRSQFCPYPCQRIARCIQLKIKKITEWGLICFNSAVLKPCFCSIENLFSEFR